MAAGVQFQDRCFATAPEAGAAYCGGLAGTVIQGGVLSCLDSYGDANKLFAHVWLQGPTGGSEMRLDTLSVPCETLDAGDGLMVGWGIAAVWIGAFAVRWLADAVRHGRDGE